MHVLGIWLACVALVVTPLYAQEARLYLEDLAEGPYASGDTVDVGIYVDAGSLPITSASVYLHIDTSHWDVVNFSENKSEVDAPFSAGPAWVTTVYENRFDRETGELSYVAVSGLGTGGTRPVGRGEFLLATLSLRIVDRPEGGMAALRMDAAGQRQPVYTRAAEPGVQYRFGLAESVLWIRVDQDKLEGSPAETEDPLLAAGSTLSLLEDGGVYRFPLGSFLHDFTEEGDFSAEVSGPVRAQIVDDVLEVEPFADAAGQGLLSMRFCSVEGRCETVDWQVVVHPLNDAPKLNPLSLLSIEVGARVSVPLSTIVHDVDDPISQLRVEERQTASVRVYESEGEVVVQGLAGGREELLLRVVDPQGAVGEGMWPIHVRAPSVGPEWIAVPQLEISTAETLRVDLTSYVRDDDTPESELTWSLSGEGIDVLWGEGGSASVYLSSLQPGQTVLYLQVRDPEGNEAITAWYITVVDAAPVEVEQSEATEVKSDREVVDVEDDPSAKEDQPVGEQPPSNPDSEAVDRSEEAVGEPVETGGDPQGSSPALAWSLTAIPPISMTAGTEGYIDLGSAVQGIDPSQLVWEAQSDQSVSVHISDGGVAVGVDSTFSGQTSVEFIATDMWGQQERVSVDFDVSPQRASWTLGDIPDETLAEGDTLFMDLSLHVNVEVHWSIAGGEGLSVRWVEGGVLISAVSGFTGRSVMIFTAVAADGSQAADIVRIDVVGAGEEVEKGDDEAAVPAPIPEESPGELTLRTWDDITLYVGDIHTTESLDGLVVEGDPSLVDWSLRGGVFVDAEITADRRIRLDGRRAQVGREVFWLTATRSGQRSERSVGIQVRLRPLALRVPTEIVSVPSEGVHLNDFVDGEPIGVLWQILEGEGMWIEENRLYANAPPGEYTILLTAQRGSDTPLEVALGVRVPVAEIPLGNAPEESVERDAEAGGIEEPHENELPPLRWAMPDRLEVEMGGSGRWPLQVREGDRLAGVLSYVVQSETGKALIEGTDLVVIEVRTPMVVSLLVTDVHGREDRVEISVIPIDHRPPIVHLEGVAVGDGIVRWTALADERIGSATMLLDNGPLVPVERSARSVTWEHQVDEEHLGHLRALIVDEAGNLTEVEQAFRAGTVGAGRVLESADGALRILKSGSGVPLLMYRAGGTYRIEYAGEHEIEIALVAPQADRVLAFEQDNTRWTLSTTWAEGRLRGRIWGAGWLSTAKGVAQAGEPLEPRCFPNPFNASVTVGLDMPDAGWLQVDVYDVLGRPVRQLLAEQRSAGPWHAVWDGRDERGRAAASGSYFIAIRAAQQRYSARVTLLR